MQRRPRARLLGAAAALLLVAVSAPACHPGTFPCGAGTCDLASQLCLVGGADACATCVARPAACAADPTCGCVPAASTFDPGCDDAGTCAEVEGGLVLTCTAPRYICG